MELRTNKKIIWLLVLVVFVSLSCNPLSAIRELGQFREGDTVPDQPATEEVLAGEEPPGGKDLPADNSLPELTRADVLALEEVTSNGEGTQGGVIQLQIRNQTDEDVLFTIPCGFFFTPSIEDEQRMMVVQPVEETVGPNSEITLEPYVICIDSGKSAPDAGSGYRLGSMVSGDLLKLAECICNEELADEVESFEDIGLQFAVWAVSDGVDFSELAELPGMAEGALGDVLGEQLGGELGEELSGLLEGLMGMYQAPTEYWLDRCGIELGK